MSRYSYIYCLPLTKSVEMIKAYGEIGSYPVQSGRFLHAYNIRFVFLCCGPFYKLACFLRSLARNRTKNLKCLRGKIDGETNDSHDSSFISASKKQIICVGSGLGMNPIKPKRKKTYVQTCAFSEGSDQHSQSLIRIFNGWILDSQGCKISVCGKRRFWSDCADAHDDLRLQWAHMWECPFSHAAVPIVVGNAQHWCKRI